MANLRNEDSWFLVAQDGGKAVAMALVLPFRTDRGRGPVVPGIAFLDLIYVLPQRWGEGIGGIVLDPDDVCCRGVDLPVVAHG